MPEYCKRKDIGILVLPNFGKVSGNQILVGKEFDQYYPHFLDICPSGYQPTEDEDIAVTKTDPAPPPLSEPVRQVPPKVDGILAMATAVAECPLPLSEVAAQVERFKKIMELAAETVVPSGVSDHVVAEPESEVITEPEVLPETVVERVEVLEVVEAAPVKPVPKKQSRKAKKR